MKLFIADESCPRATRPDPFLVPFLRKHALKAWEQEKKNDRACGPLGTIKIIWKFLDPEHRVLLFSFHFGIQELRPVAAQIIFILSPAGPQGPFISRYHSLTVVN